MYWALKYRTLDSVWISRFPEICYKVRERQQTIRTVLISVEFWTFMNSDKNDLLHYFLYAFLCDPLYDRFKIYEKELY